MNKIFLRFTIKGDDLSVFDMLNDISVKADVYEKGRIYSNAFGGKSSPQSTNRWVYSNEVVDYSKPETFLTKNLLTLKKYLPILRTIIPNYECRIDLILYSGNKTDICLNIK